jgi:hypothetical protein
MIEKEKLTEDETVELCTVLLPIVSKIPAKAINILLTEHSEFKDLTEHQLYDLIELDKRVVEIFKNTKDKIFKEVLTKEQQDRYIYLINKNFGK